MFAVSVLRFRSERRVLIEWFDCRIFWFVVPLKNYSDQVRTEDRNAEIDHAKRSEFETFQLFEASTKHWASDLSDEEGDHENC